MGACGDNRARVRVVYRARVRERVRGSALNPEPRNLSRRRPRHRRHARAPDAR